jgi:hypothetical protein
MDYRVKLTKIESNHNNLRTNEVVGVTNKLPEVGMRFQMLAAPLQTGHVRYVDTSPIQNIFKVDDNTQTLHTMNSIYEFEVISSGN